MTIITINHNLKNFIKMETFIIPNAMDILKENYRMSEEEMTFKQWAKLTSESDPKFYNWLFGNAENINDFGNGMTQEQEMEAGEFFGFIGAESIYMEQLKQEENEL